MDWSTNSAFWGRLQQADMQGLSYKEAFAILAAEKVSEVGNISLPSLIDKLQELGELESLQTLVQQGTEPAARVIGLLETLRDFGGSDIVLKKGHHHRVLMESLVAAGQLSASAGQSILASVTTKHKTWAGLKPGHIQNARYHMTGIRQGN